MTIIALGKKYEEETKMEGRDTLIRVSYDLDGMTITENVRNEELDDLRSIIRWFSSIKKSKDIFVRTVFFRGFIRNWYAPCREAFY